MKKVLKILGWIVFPYIMIFIFWRKIGNIGRIAGAIWAGYLVINIIHNMSTMGPPDEQVSSNSQSVKHQQSTENHQEVATTSASNVSSTATTDNSSKTAREQKSSDAKQNQSQKGADQAKQAQAAADAKATQRAELQALGDWNIKSNSDDFAKRYTKVQQYISQGDRQSAYDEATMASKRADDLNSKTMNKQDMQNVPKDIPSSVRDILSNVDPHLAQAYMLEKQGFDALADGINDNNVSKISEAKDNFAIANDEFNQAKALIDKANAALK